MIVLAETTNRWATLNTNPWIYRFISYIVINISFSYFNKDVMEI